jgi:hypothetical protein
MQFSGTFSGREASVCVGGAVVKEADIEGIWRAGRRERALFGSTQVLLLVLNGWELKRRS